MKMKWYRYVVNAGSVLRMLARRPATFDGQLVVSYALRFDLLRFDLLRFALTMQPYVSHTHSVTSTV